MKFYLLINIKMPTIVVVILVFIDRKNFMLSSSVQEESCQYLIFYR